MKNLGNLMKQAKAMQEKMESMQAELENLEVTGEAGAGMVRATMTAKGAVRQVKIDPSLLDPNDPEMVEDLVVAALNDAKRRADETMKERMSEVTGGLDLPPGMKLPF